MKNLLPVGLRQSSSVPGSSLTTVVLAVIVVGGLYLGREVLVPMALAVLLSFVLAPLVRMLEAIYVPRMVSVLVVVILAFLAIFSLGALMVTQVNQLASDLPRYQSTLREKIQNLRGATASVSTLERASDVLKELGNEIEKPGNSLTTGGDRNAPTRAIPVEIKQPDPTALQTLVALITPLIHPLATTGIVIVFVIFVLLQRQDLRNRLVRLAGAQDLQRTTAALDDAGQRLSRLFLAQLFVNASFGLVIGVGLWAIGVPSAPLWGMLGMILRFVPYVGAVISAVFPLVLAAAVGPGWTMAMWTAALFLIVEPVVGHGIEPLVYGHSTGLSPVSVIVSAAFWTWLWGPIGLILAMPLTVCLVVLGRHVERLKFLEVMFGDRPPLTPPELVYQRLLARDTVEAAEQAQKFLKEKPLVAYYDEILVEGLKLAHADTMRGLLDEERQRSIRDAVAEVIDDLDSHENVLPVSGKINEGTDGSLPLVQIEKAETNSEGKSIADSWKSPQAVLCVPGLGALDEAAAMMVTQLVRREGVGAKSEHAETLSMSRIFSWEPAGAKLICLCYVENATSAQIRYAVRRIQRKAPDVILLVALLGGSAESGLQDQFTAIEVLYSLQATLERIMALASHSLVQNPDVPVASHLSAAI